MRGLKDNLGERSLRGNCLQVLLTQPIDRHGEPFGEELALKLMLNPATGSTVSSSSSDYEVQLALREMAAFGLVDSDDVVSWLYYTNMCFEPPDSLSQTAPAQFISTPICKTSGLMPCPSSFAHPGAYRKLSILLCCQLETVCGDYRAAQHTARHQHLPLTATC